MRGLSTNPTPRETAERINGLILGRGNNKHTVTLTANAASTVVDNPAVHEGSVIHFMPTTANAAAELASGNMYVSSRGSGTFTITHNNAASIDRTFEFTFTG